MKEIREKLEIIGTEMENIPDDILTVAFTHRSSCLLHEEDYQRYEFLGDSILNTITSTMIFSKYRLSEGWMTNVRSHLVSNKMLAEYIKTKGLYKYIRYSRGTSPSVDTIADVFEAIIGVFYSYLIIDRKDVSPIPILISWIDKIWNFSSIIDQYISDNREKIGIDDDGYYPWTKWSEGYIEIDSIKYRLRYRYPLLLSMQTQKEQKIYIDLTIFIPHTEFKNKSIQEKKSTLLSEIDYVRKIANDPSLYKEIETQLTNNNSGLNVNKLSSIRHSVFNKAVQYS